MLVCGPPGAGKTTLARSLGLTVYDIDDRQWNGSESVLRAHLARLAADLDARAVVIRSGATRSARAKAAALIGATEIVVVDTPAEECVRRVTKRNRPRPPLRMQIAAVESWWQRYEPESAGRVPVAGVTIRDW